VLKELHALRLVEQQDPPLGEKGWRYSLAEDTDGVTLDRLITRNVSRGNLGNEEESPTDPDSGVDQAAPSRGVPTSHISGDSQPTLRLVDPEADRELARAVAHVEFAQWLDDLVSKHAGATIDDIDAAEQLRDQKESRS
jgi:hypothetical protein